MAPESAGNRITLAKVLMSTGLKRNAQRELEEALTHHPNDATVKDLLKQIHDDDAE
ncbi:MAG: hypothetical protein IPJ88_17575 [Myxococcales bacterium]|nr:MAG: hypothetical protein IPJ88_17575 [Myxococcales bacterium]